MFKYYKFVYNIQKIENKNIYDYHNKINLRWKKENLTLKKNIKHVMQFW